MTDRYSNSFWTRDIVLGLLLGAVSGALIFFPGLGWKANRLEADDEVALKKGYMQKILEEELSGAYIDQVLADPQVMEEADTEDEPEPKAEIGYVYWKTVRSRVTAYTPGPESCGKWTDGQTSTGRDAWALMGVAADPKIVPYGSYVEIPGAGFLLVDDTGSAMRESWTKDQYIHFDLRMRSLKEAKNWGVRYLNVNIYKPRSL